MAAGDYDTVLELLAGPFRRDDSDDVLGFHPRAREVTASDGTAAAARAGRDPGASAVGGSLDHRMPRGEASLRRAAWAGLQDSMPRAALLSIHARVEGTAQTAWEEAPLIQVWGPRYSAYVIATADRAVFTVGRLPDDAGSRRAAEDIATRLDAFLDGRVMGADEAARGIGVRHPNALRYGAPTGRILIHWDGARRPTIWTLPPPTSETTSIVSSVTRMGV
jgi:hypothetical protein